MMRKTIICLLAVFCVAGAAFAQIDPTVEVSRAYQMQLSEIVKPTVKTAIDDSLKKFDISFDYSIFDRPYLDLYEFVPYQIMSLDKSVSVRHPNFAAKIGTQYPLMPDISVYAQFVDSPHVNASVYGLHNSLFDNLSGLNGNTFFTSRMDNRIGANLRGAWNTGEVNVDFRYRMADTKDTYDLGTAVTGEHKVSGMNVLLSAKSAFKEDNSLFYNVDMRYSNTGKQTFLPDPDSVFRENMLDVAMKIGASFEDNRIYVNIRTKNGWYAEREGKTLGVVEITPMYEYQSDRVKAKIGVKFGNRYGMDETTDIAPDIKVRIEAVKRMLWIRASFTGGNDLVTLSDAAYDLPWILPNQQFSRIPIEGEIALESVLWSRLAINVVGAYVVHVDGFRLMPSFNENLLPVLLPVYSDYNRLTAGIDASWKSQPLKMSGSFRYNKYSAAEGEKLYMLPSIEASANLEYNYMRRIFFSVGLSYMSSQECAMGTIPSYVDLSCRADYMYNRHIAFFVKGGNLLDRENYRYSGIPSERINVGGGICLNF